MWAAGCSNLIGSVLEFCAACALADDGDAHLSETRGAETIRFGSGPSGGLFDCSRATVESPPAVGLHID